MSRDPLTEHHYPDRVSIDEFVRMVTSDLSTFSQNMKNLHIDDDRYPERWMKLFVNWSELNSERYKNDT